MLYLSGKYCGLCAEEPARGRFRGEEQQLTGCESLCRMARVVCADVSATDHFLDVGPHDELRLADIASKAMQIERTFAGDHRLDRSAVGPFNSDPGSRLDVLGLLFGRNRRVRFMWSSSGHCRSHNADVKKRAKDEANDGVGFHFYMVF